MKRAKKVGFSLAMAFVYTWAVIGFLTHQPEGLIFGALTRITMFLSWVALGVFYATAVLRTGLAGQDDRNMTFLYHHMACCFAIMAWFWMFPKDHLELLQYWPIIMGANILALVFAFGSWTSKYSKENQ